MKMLCVAHERNLQVYETISSGALSLTGGALTTTLPFPVTELRQEGTLLGRPAVMGRHCGLQDNSTIKLKLLFF